MQKRALLLIFSTAIISGISIYLNKYAVGGIDSSVFTFLKNILVAVFLLSLILITKSNEFFKLKKRDWAKLVVIGLIGGSVPFLLYFRGLQLTTAASASLIHKTMFIFVTALALTFLKEKLNRTVFIALTFLLIGNYLLIKPTFSFNLGDLFILSATILWAVENILSKHALKNISGNMVAFGRMFFGSLFILLFLFVTNKTNFGFSTSQIFWVFLTTIMLVLYVVTWYNGLKYIDVSLASSILLLGSPVTTLLTYGINIELGQILGIMLLGAGILVFMNSTSQIELKAWTKH